MVVQTSQAERLRLRRNLATRNDIFLLVVIQNNDESNRKSTLCIIFISIFREIVILLVTTYTKRHGYDAILDFQQ